MATHEKPYDLLLKNGRVLCPAQQLDANLDIAVRDGQIIKLEKDLTIQDAALVIDASGLLITPGLIDMHVHVCPSLPYRADALPCMPPDVGTLSCGVTTVVDAGTTGLRDFENFLCTVIRPATVRTLAMLNIADGGMLDFSSEQDPSAFHPAKVAELVHQYPDIIVGIKSAHYWVGKPFTEEHPAWASVDATLEAAQLCSRFAMIDFQPTLPGRSYKQLLQKLRKGDIHTHMYAQQFPILKQDGHVQDYLLEARKRGVCFDLGHGRSSFWLRNAVPAMADGFVPDTLSSDFYFDNCNGPVFGFTDILSKMHCLGLSLNETIARATSIPARQIGHPELGTLKPGSEADIALFRVREGCFGFPDGGGAAMRGSTRLECLITVRAGKIVYDREALSKPDWQKAGPEYWVAPGKLPLPY